jgi:hypothetical protein
MSESQLTDEVRRTGPFRPHSPPPCPECGGEAWLVGRHVAECAGCAALLPQAHGSSFGLPRPHLVRHAGRAVPRPVVRLAWLR